MIGPSADRHGTPVGAEPSHAGSKDVLVRAGQSFNLSHGPPPRFRDSPFSASGRPRSEQTSASKRHNRGRNSPLRHDGQVASVASVTTIGAIPGKMAAG